MNSLNPEYLEKIIIKSYLEDKHFCTLLSSEAEERFFENPEAAEIFSISKEYFKKYIELAPKDIIINSSKKSKEIEKYLGDLSQVEDSNDVFLYEQTEKWLKESAFKYAIMDSVDLVKKKDDINKAREYIENALTRTLKKQIGLDYWGDISERLKRMFSAENQRIPSYYPQLDEYLNGGFTPYSLSVILASMHGNKSNLMINIATRQMMHGHNVAYLSLEMSEDELAKRVDAQLTKLDINRIYDSKRKEFVSTLKTIKTGNEGKLFIKQFPTGTASVNDFRSYLYELQMRNIDLECIFVDYLNIMKPTTRSGDGNLYTDVKKIGEELRAMSYIFKCPTVSATQVNRCLKLDTNVIIMSPDGTEKSIEIKDIKEGDFIKSNLCFNSVTRVFPIEKQKAFKVSLEDGKTISCSGRHLFPAYDETGVFMGNMTIKEIKNKNLYLMVE